MPKDLTPIEETYTPRRHITLLSVPMPIGGPKCADIKCEYQAIDKNGDVIDGKQIPPEQFTITEAELLELPEFAQLYATLSAICHAYADAKGF